MIARQLIELRKRRGLNQQKLAELAGTGQPAISRAERANYRNWSFNTLRRLAEAMDARIRVIIEPAEDVLGEYETEVELIQSPLTRFRAANLEQAGQTGNQLGSVVDKVANRETSNLSSLVHLKNDPYSLDRRIWNSSQ